METSRDTIGDSTSIRALKSTYARLCDERYDPDQLPRLFTEDGVWARAEGPSYAGRESIRDLMRDNAKKYSWAAHWVGNATILIDPSGVRARGKWLLLCLLRLTEVPDSLSYVVGHYEDTLEKQGEMWAFSRLTVFVDRSGLVPVDLAELVNKANKPDALVDEDARSVSPWCLFDPRWK